MIYYFCPDYDVPSWGVGMLYYHVYFLNRNNIDACILHTKPAFKLSWLSLNVPIKYIQQNVKPLADEIMVVPEFYAADKNLQQYRCRKIVFVQNAFILFERISPAQLNELGYEAAFYYMPHLKKLLDSYFSGPVYETPSFIADYFFKEKEKLMERKKQIVIYPKTANRDYEIIYRFLHNDFKQLSRFKSLFSSTEKRNNWKIIILKDLSHKEVAKVLKEAEFFICLNTHESFNASVPEAMAAGCINFTYDALGPADFLKNRKNAFVYNNNHVFALFDELRYYIDHFDEPKIIEDLNEIRLNAHETANCYTMEKAEETIINVFRNLLN